MKERSWFVLPLASIVAVCAGPSFAIAQRLIAKQQAEQILQACNVKGGVVVHIGCGEGKLTAALRANDSYLVHGLDTSAKSINGARKYVQSLGLRGVVTFSVLAGQRLPFIDNLVNLVLCENLGDLPTAEVMRVLCPKGVAYVKTGDKWVKTIKPWPVEIDEWTHFLHGPDGNAVASDTVVGSPFHMQWVAAPAHSKTHSHLSSVNVMVSAGGRLFYIVDEGPTALPYSLPSRWNLVARDAFNGVVLWRRPLASWQPADMSSRHLFPVDLYRRLVAEQDRVYATLSIFGPVVSLDAATGRTIKIYDGTENTEEIICERGVLFVVAGTSPPGTVDRRQLAQWRPQPEEKRIIAVQAETGEVLWEERGQDTVGLMPMTLAVRHGRALFQNAENIICLDSQTGEQLWRSARVAPYARPGWSAPTLVVHDEVVFSATRQGGAEPSPRQKKAGTWRAGDVVVLSAKTGQRLWTSQCAEGCGSPVDVFVAAGLVWVGEKVGRNEHDYRNARDLRTGSIVREYPSSPGWVDHHHHRCYRDKATDRYILAGRTGVEFIDLSTGEVAPHHWIRGICKYGILPCNGLLYLPPDQCGCYIESKLTGFHALAPKREPSGEGARFGRQGSDRLERGAAYNGKIKSQESKVKDSEPWSTYRGGPDRSGCSEMRVPVDLKRAWATELGGRLTPPVVADGRLFVAAVDAHLIHALGADSGKRLWSYMAGGRIDSPPTIANGLAVFGCRDGWVYALRASDGQLVWRFRAAPEDERLVADGQLESVWPVHGSVLILNSTVYCAAGRSSYLDGGVWMYKLDLLSGRTILQKRFDSRDPKTGGMVNLYEPFKAEILPDRELPSVLPDILSSDGTNIWMRAVTFDRDLGIRREHPPHLFCSMGFCDDSWWERTYWIYGPHFYSGAAGVHFAKGVSSSGRILVYDDACVYGYQDETFASAGIFSAGKEPRLAQIDAAKFEKAKYRNARHTKVVHNWHKDVPLYGFGLVVAGQTLFIAGPPQFDEQNARAYLSTCKTDDYELNAVLRNSLDLFAGSGGALLWAVNKADGKKLAEYRLDSPPVFDGMAAAYGRLYVSDTEGRVVCLQGGQQIQRRPQ